MKILLSIGIVLILLGGVILVRGLSFTTERTVFQIGTFEASVEQKRTVPSWAGGAALAAGAVCIVLGLKRRR